MNEFGQKLLKAQERQLLYERVMNRGAKEFADKLNEAREKDALEFVEQAKRSISGLSEEDKLRTLCVLACNKLFDTGYREFAGLFKQVLVESGK